MRTWERYTRPMDAHTIRPYFLLTILIGAGTLAFLVFRPFLAPLALAIVFAVVLYPLFRQVARGMGKYRGLAALLTVVLSVVLILAPLFIIGTLIFNQAAELYLSLTSDSGKAYLADVGTRALTYVEPYFPGVASAQATFIANIGTYAERGLGIVLAHFGAVLSSITSFLLSLVIFFIALYYLLKDGPKLKRAVIGLSPLLDIDDETVFARLERAINSVIKGNLTIAFIQGIVSGIGFAIFGVPNAILWGTVTAFAALIPGVGTALVFAPAILYLFLVGATVQALGLLVWGVLAVGMIDNFLGPKLVGQGIGLHPLLILLSVLGGLAFFGPIGIFLGPLTISLLFTLLSLYAETARARKQQIM